jgi:PQQ system protein
MIITDYARLLRPSVLRQLNPSMVRLINELPGLDRQNKAILGRLFVHGGLGYARKGRDDRLRAQVRIPRHAYVWKPSVIVMPHGGDLEIEVVNDDPSPHAAVLPSNGDKQWLWLPVYSRGTATLNLDGPGYYWFASAIENDQGRGLTGVILVLGDVPAEARLDRPKQPRP